MSVGIGDSDQNHNQFTGSIFAGAVGADLYSNASTNGRVISFGNFTAGEGHGDQKGRMEFHSFPFIYPNFMDCSSNKSASFALSKALIGTNGAPLSDEDVRAFEQAGTMFKVKVAWTDASGAPQSKEILVPANGTQVPGPQDIVIPEGGVDVTFTESGVVSPPEGYTFEGSEFSAGDQKGSPLTVRVTDGDVVSVSLANKYSTPKPATGTFSLRKVVDHPVGENLLEDATFQVQASWSVDGEPTSAVIDLMGDGSTVASGLDLPVGTEVTFEEIGWPEAPAGWVYGGVTFSHDSLIIGQDEEAVVTVTNTYGVPETGSFALSKVVNHPVGDNLLADETFEVKASWNIDGEDFSESFPLKGDGTVVSSVNDLPVGTEVTFEEIGYPTTPEDWVFEGVEFSQDSLIIGVDEMPTIIATNTYTKVEPAPVGGFNLKKSLCCGEILEHMADAVFTVQASWTIDGELVTEEYALKGDGTVVSGPQDLPVGTVVTFSEIYFPQTPEGWTFEGVQFSTQELVIEAGQSVTVTATNTYTKVGQFEVSKAFEGGITASDFPADTTFTVEATWTPEGEGQLPVTELLEVRADGTPTQSGYILPAGTEVTFSEIVDATGVEGWQFVGATFDPSTIVIGEEDGASVVVTNQYVRTGTFAVAKQFSGGITPEDFPAETFFTVNASWTNTDGELQTETLLLPATGEEVSSVNQIPVGTEVSFIEVDVPSAEGWKFEGAIFDPSTLVIGEGESGLVTVTNTYAPEEVPVEKGTFQIRKVVEGLPQDIAAATDFDITASWVEDDQAQEVTFAVSGDGSPVESGIELPIGTVVTFGEGEAPEVEGFTWDGVTFSDESIEISSEAVVTVTAVNSYGEIAGPGDSTGGFSLEKKLEGVDSKDLPADTVFKVRATWSVEDVIYSEVYELKADGTSVMGPQDLPVGTEVTFEEIDVPTIQGYKWKESVFSDSNIVVEAGETHDVTLLNKYVKEGGRLPVTGAGAIGTLALLGGGSLLAGAFLKRRRNA